MSDLQEVFDALSAPFRKEDIRYYAMNQNKAKTWGNVAYYADARAVRRRLNNVLGVGNWETNVRSPQKGRVIVDLTIHLDDGVSITRSDGADETGSEGERFKGGISNALRRVAYQFGVGEYFYELGDIWMKMHKKGDVDNNTFYEYNGFKEDPLNRIPNEYLHEDDRGGTSKRTTSNSGSQKAPPKSFKRRLREASKDKSNEAVKQVYADHGIKDGKVPSDLDKEQLLEDIKNLEVE